MLNPPCCGRKPAHQGLGVRSGIANKLVDGGANADGMNVAGGAKVRFGGGGGDAGGAGNNDAVRGSGAASTAAGVSRSVDTIGARRAR